MALKFKDRLICSGTKRGKPTSNGGYETIDDCRWVSEVLQYWQLSPESINIQWEEGTAIPSSELVKVQFPEYDGFSNVPDLKAIRYRIIQEEGSANSLQFVEIRSKESLDYLPPSGMTQYEVFYKNFDQLPNTKVLIRMRCQVVGIFQNGSERLLEERIQEIHIGKVSSYNEDLPQIIVENPHIYINYNKATKRYTGNRTLRIKIEKSSLSIYNKITLRLLSEAQAGKKSKLYKNKFVYEKRDGYLELSIPDDCLSDAVNATLKEYKMSVAWGFFLPDVIKAGFTVHINYKEYSDAVELSESVFKFRLLEHENKRASGSFRIINTEAITVSIENSPWLNVSQSDGTISFESKTAKELKAGIHKGFIKVNSSVAGMKSAIASIEIEVERIVDNPLGAINFCLDNLPIIVKKKHANSLYVQMELIMQLHGYDQKEREVKQVYEYVFYKGEVTLFPGEDVQDFFSEIENLGQLHINESTIISPKPLFKACKTQITLSECDRKGNVLERHQLGWFHFLPGRKPKGYPYLTNGTIRSTYSQSLLCISALAEDFLAHQLGKIGGNLVDTSHIKDMKSVVNLSFGRAIADKTYGGLSIIEHKGLELIPITNVSNVIDVVFQNQNYCPDWFSFSGEWEDHREYTHTLSKRIAKDIGSAKASRHQEYKALSEQKKVLKLNTGWILEEESEVLAELIASPLCFGRIRGKWQRLIPISKKIVAYDSSENVRSFIVEFATDVE